MSSSDRIELGGTGYEVGSTVTLSFNVTDTGVTANYPYYKMYGSSLNYNGKYHFLGVGTTTTYVMYPKNYGKVTFTERILAGGTTGRRHYIIGGIYVEKQNTNINYSDNRKEIVIPATGSVSYTNELTAKTGYRIDSITVTMGGNDVTASVLENNNINIPSITGDIAINVETTKISTTKI